MAIFYLTNLTGIFEPPGTETEKRKLKPEKSDNGNVTETKLCIPKRDLDEYQPYG